ncbi:MAG: helix-turn-helix transcriptional regulator [Candidatus Harrisonbacteria bacterium]|nr:helix-turn-helix transcriptional regulator [Candidatus Harrisonbacteria bacterium]
MHTFPELLKNIREQGNLTQEELARALGVSTILISMVETGQKEVSKNLVIKLADRLGVHPSSIMPFVFIGENDNLPNLSGIEKTFVEWGEKLQNYLIKVKSKKLKKYA